MRHPTRPNFAESQPRGRKEEREKRKKEEEARIKELEKAQKDVCRRSFSPLAPGPMLTSRVALQLTAQRKSREASAAKSAETSVRMITEKSIPREQP